MATISNNEIKIKYTLDTTDLANATQLFDRLSAEDRQLLNDLKRLQAQLNATGQAGQQAGQNISQGARNAGKEINLLQASIKQVGNYLITYFSVQALAHFGKAVIDTTIKMQGLTKAIEYTSGSLSAGIANFQFLQRIAEELGLPLEAAAEGFKSMSAAASRAGITFSSQQEMFEDLSKAMSALQLDAQSASLVFFGFGQMMSKAKVSAQELYHQIGERMPIAMEAAQIAAGRLKGEVKVTTSELIKMVEEGKLVSTEFVPEFTKAMGELAGSAAYVDTLGKGFTRLKNSWDEMLYAMGNSTDGFLNRVVTGFSVAFDKIAELIGGDDAKFTKIIGTYFEDTYELNKEKSEEFLQQQADLFEKEKDAQLKLVEKYKKDLEATDLKWYEKIFHVSTAEEEQTKKRIEELLYEAKYRYSAAQGQFDAFRKLLMEKSTTPPPPEDEEEERRKRQKALEDAYRKELARLEAQQKAKSDIIKSEMEDNILRDIQLAKNNEYWNNLMYQVDLKYSKMGIELAKNNKVKRAAEVKLDRATQVQLVKEANEKAEKIEKDYIAKAEEAIQDAARKRQQALQTEQEKELAQTEDFYDDQLKALEEKFKEAYKIAMADHSKQLELQKNFDAESIKLENARNQERALINKKYKEQEQIDSSRNANDVAAIYIQAAGLRNANLAKSEQERLDIQDETNKSLISNEIDKNTKEMNLLSQNLGEYASKSLSEKKDLNDKLIAQNVLLNEQLTEVDRAAEQRRYEIKLEKLNLTLQLTQTITDGINSIVQQQYANELTLLDKKYDQEMRLAGDNEQKKAQLQQDLEAKQKEIKIKQFNADKMAAIARIIFESASQIAANALNPVTLPYIIAIQAAQLAAVAAQPVPEFAEGTKGRKFKGGRAMVGERGTEKIITESGKVYYTPDTATLMDLPKGSQVIPNHALTQSELFWANAINDGRPINPGGGIENKLDKIGGILESLPIHQINMNERGFEKFIRTPRRTTKILNNRFPTLIR